MKKDKKKKMLQSDLQNGGERKRKIIKEKNKKRSGDKKITNFELFTQRAASLGIFGYP